MDLAKIRQVHRTTSFRLAEHDVDLVYRLGYIAGDISDWLYGADTDEATDRAMLERLIVSWGVEDVEPTAAAMEAKLPDWFLRLVKDVIRENTRRLT